MLFNVNMINFSLSLFILGAISSSVEELSKCLIEYRLSNLTQSYSAERQGEEKRSFGVLYRISKCGFFFKEHREKAKRLDA